MSRGDTRESGLWINGKRLRWVGLQRQYTMVHQKPACEQLNIINIWVEFEPLKTDRFDTPVVL